MEKLSRTEKYKELRQSLQNDVGQDLETRDLSRFQNRLNQIDPNAFSAPKKNIPKEDTDYNPSHARKDTLDPNDISFDNTMNMHYQDKEPQFDGSAASDAFSNDYLDRYIDEVKQYNIEQGNAVSEDTTVNILNRIRQAENALPSSRPYPKTPKENKPTLEDTTDVPFVKPSSVSSNSTVKNIASQVQSLVNEPEEDDDFDIADIPEPPKKEKSSGSGMNTNEFNKHLEMERTTRQQLLNETTQMRSQLDDYEDNLSEVSAKMRHTNKVLNIVLVIMIIVLAMVLFFILYLILSNKGA